MNKRERQALCDRTPLPFTPIAWEKSDGTPVEPPIRWGVICTPGDARVFVQHANPHMVWEAE